MEKLSILCARLLKDPKTIKTLLKNNVFSPTLKKELYCNLQYQQLQKQSECIKQYNTTKKENILLCGSVQSGKTNEMLMYCWWSIFIAKRKVVFLCRNIKADKAQLLERIKLFNLSFITKKKLYITNNDIIIGLSNFVQVRKIYNTIHTQQYNLCIDEADYAVKSRNNTSRLEEYLHHLEHKAQHQLGATATHFAVMSTKNKLKVIELKKPNNYYGIDKLNVKFTTIPKGFTLSKNPDTDPNIPTVYQDFLTAKEGILLHSTTKLKIGHKVIMSKIKKLYPSLTVLTYNGEGITVRCYKGHNNKPLMDNHKVYSQHTITLQQETFTIHNFTKSVTINDVLLILKKQGHKHIAIIAGHLASRGISLVSSDYKHHLTHQYYHPGPNAHGETILQGLRILGCYNDNPNLLLYCTKTTWKNIKEQYKILQKYVKKLKGKDDIVERFQNIKTKEPKRRLSRTRIHTGLRMKRTKGSSRIQYTIVNDLKEENTNEQENTTEQQ